MESNTQEPSYYGVSTPPSPLDNEAFLQMVEESTPNHAEQRPAIESSFNLTPTIETIMQSNSQEPISSRSSMAPTLIGAEELISKQAGHSRSGSLWTPLSPNLDHDRTALLQDAEKSTPQQAEHHAALGPPKQRSNIAKRLYSSWKSLQWKAEIMSWIAGFCFFMGTVSVLIAFDHHPQPNLMFGITLNALVGLLGTFADFCFMVAASSAFGQLKWLRALRKRPMIEFKAIDEASRGPWGSFMLLVRRTGGLVAVIGAVVTIIALGSSTFFQQTIGYETLYSNKTINGSMPIAQYMIGSGPSGSYLFQETQDASGIDYSITSQISDRVDVELIPSPYFAFFSPPKTNFTAKAHCETNNCTWKYTTLAICNTCENISSQLQSSNLWSYWPHQQILNWSLPNGFGFPGVPDASYKGSGLPEGAVYQVLNVTTGTTGDVNGNLWNTANSIAFPSNGSELLRVFVIGPAPGKTPTHFVNSSYINDTLRSLFAPPVAYECLLQACVQERHARFLNGALNDIVVSNHTNSTQSITQQANKKVAITNITITLQNSTFVVNSNSTVSFAMWLAGLLSGNVTLFPQETDSDNFNPNTMNIVTSQPLLQAIYLAMNNSTTGFPDLMDNLANSLSANLRTTKYQPPAVAGIAYSPMSHVIVTWRWLALPLVELVGSLAFLIAVIIETKNRKLKPWTNNILATLFHGFNARPLRQHLQENESSMNKEACNLEMEFLPHEAGGSCLAVVQPNLP